MTLDAIDITAIVFQSISAFILIPLILYYTYQFYLLKNEAIMQYRSVCLVYIINFITIFSLAIERTYATLSRVWLVIDVPIWTVFCFIAASWWAATTLFVVKVYNLYYQQQYHRSIADLSWQKDINPNHNDWYIQNKNKYGKISYLITLAFIPYLITVLVESVVPYITGDGLVFFFVHTIFASIPNSISFSIFWKAKSLKDVYSIRDEILYQCILLAIALIPFAISSFHFRFGIGKIKSVNETRIEYLLHIPMVFAVAIALSIIPTAYPVYKYKRMIIQNKLSQNIQLESNTQLQSPNTHSREEHITKYIGMQGLNSILSEYESFKGFMQHLVSEFCSECLLFTVELIQVKHSYQTRNNNVICIPKRNIIQPEYYKELSSVEINSEKLQKKK
eukprot:140475_1